MSMSDPIGDMLTRIRNAGRAKHETCLVPGSKIKKSILDLMKEEGFIRDYEPVKVNETFEDYKVFLKYDQTKRPIIRELIRVSTPGRRVYIKSAEIRPYKNNIGTMIVSTSKGIMTGKNARKLKLGGEVILKMS
ncbi:30S ribosomal protein S8 [Leptospira sp. 201903070]|jgi:small subunit ribosomal protein S8|uniref:Small ribosomal subunit protein uS8 n=3 Tax=Leptospira TaxID=171 RepID=A0A4R9L9C5_9LEPT|nr:MULTISPECIES: 30S ribosomal protein S8 [Leptospira]AOP35163.1 30S ribosomal protein S8 [Leptospira tipperaryensis]MBM9502724.1 30S ribosomal protein S8 [Leptospira ainazelensis]MBM9578480.1 30S ribosomal protein S8 [Leptospira ainlahdjerensis]RHX88425.1 30S ribosomal protein S8 [Leptospira stimsonii]RHX92830.1 30S ribosomal protein S8 [Leptospira stimsonii]